jgi:hypothetical protein
VGAVNVSDLLVGGSAWWIVPVSLLVFGATFGLLPGLILRLLVLLYPKEHPRREELFAELYAPEMGRFERFEWVFQQVETAFRQGPALRKRARAEQQADPDTDASDEASENSEADNTDNASKPPDVTVRRIEVQLTDKARTALDTVAAEHNIVTRQQIEQLKAKLSLDVDSANWVG